VLTAHRAAVALRIRHAAVCRACETDAATAHCRRLATMRWNRTSWTQPAICAKRATSPRKCCCVTRATVAGIYTVSTRRSRHGFSEALRPVPCALSSVHLPARGSFVGQLRCNKTWGLCDDSGLLSGAKAQLISVWPCRRSRRATGAAQSVWRRAPSGCRILTPRAG